VGGLLGANNTDPAFVEARRRALEAYLNDLRRVVLESAVDYHRVVTDQPYEQVLARFLVGRAAWRGLR
jgi:hypothetical protein